MRNIPTVKRKIQELVTQAGIYHNPSLGLISLSSDGENWITIADKNLWATQVWNEWDEVTQENCWWFFQTWNNYMFPFSWPEKKWYITVDFSQYWPWNYYSCDTFWLNDAVWQGIDDNPNLWWLETWTYEAMRWPCPEWYHVPKESEYWEVASMFSVPISYLKTAAVVLSNDWEDKITSWRVSSPFYCTLNDDGSWYGRFVRPFKNEPVVPTSERTVLYQPS